MIDLKKYNLEDLKQIHKIVYEKIEHAEENRNEEYINGELNIDRIPPPDYTRVQEEDMMKLIIINEELARRGYDYNKLYKRDSRYD